MSWWNAFFKKPEQLENRRNHQRLSLEVPIVVSPKPGQEILGKVCDLSPDGCRIELAANLEKKDRLQFKLLPGLQLPGNPHHDGRLLWSRQQSDQVNLGLCELTSDGCLPQLYQRLVQPHRPCQSIDPRRFIRFSGTGFTVSLENLTVGWQGQGRILDLSLSGCQLVAPREFARVGHFVRVTFRGWFGVTVVGHVVRHNGLCLALSLDPGHVGSRFRSLLGRLARSGAVAPTSREGLCLADLIPGPTTQSENEGRQTIKSRVAGRTGPFRNGKTPRRCPSLWSARCLLPSLTPETARADS